MIAPAGTAANGSSVTDSSPQDEDASDLTGALALDPRVPNPARMWNYWVGGKDNFAAAISALSHVRRCFRTP